MAGLSDEQKARIRAEEEQRAQALLEERYRQQVRDELAAGQGGAVPTPGGAVEAPAVAARGRQAQPPAVRERQAQPPAAQGRQAQPPAAPGGGTALGLWLGAGLLFAAAAALAVLAFAGGGAVAGPGGDDAELGPPEIMAAGDGALTRVAPARWDPAELGFSGFEVGDDGVVRKVAPTGTRTLAELSASADAGAAPRNPVLPEPPPLSELPAPSAAGAVAVPGAEALPPVFDGMVRFVPADAWLVIAVNGASLGTSRVLRRLFDDVVREAHAEPQLARLAERAGVRVPDDVSVALFAATPAIRRDGEEFMLGLAGTFDGRRVMDFYAGEAATTRRVEGPPLTWIETGRGGVALGDGFVVAGATATFQAALAARTGNGALLSPTLGPALRAARTAPSAFVVMVLTGEPARTLAAGLPALAGATLLVVRVDARAGLALDAALTVADADAAAAVVRAVDGARSGSSPLAALVLARVRAWADGATARFSLRVSDDEAVAIYAALLAGDR